MSTTSSDVPNRTLRPFPDAGTQRESGWDSGGNSGRNPSWDRDWLLAKLLPAAIYGFVFAAVATAFLANTERSVSLFYEQAAEHWLNGESLYSHSAATGEGFLYLPHAAIMHTPFFGLSHLTGVVTAGDFAWRLFSWALLAAACWQFANNLRAPAKNVQWRMAAIVCLLGLSCLRNGQSTMLMTACMLFAVDRWRATRFVHSSILLATAVAIKPLAIVLYLLCFAVEPKMRKPLAICGLCLALLPFALQSPAYVLQQYSDCVAMLLTSAEKGNVRPGAQLFGMLDALGISVTGSVQTGLRMLAALGTLALVFLGSRKLDRSSQAVWLVTWTMVYLMLFNPRTENSTYCMLGPVFAYFVAKAVCERRNYFAGTCLLTLAILAAGSYEIGKFIIATEISSVWLAPLAATVFTGYLLPVYLLRLRKPAPVSSCKHESLPESKRAA